MILEDLVSTCGTQIVVEEHRESHSTLFEHIVAGEGEDGVFLLRDVNLDGHHIVGEPVGDVLAVENLDRGLGGLGVFECRELLVLNSVEQDDQYKKHQKNTRHRTYGDDLLTLCKLFPQLK